MTLRLRLRQFLARDQFAHVARSSFRRASSLDLHEHDFAEVFWVERGRGVHLVNGRRLPLRRGCVTLIRPTDRHTFTGSGQLPLTILNVAFDAAVLDHLQQRYFPDPHAWPWRGGELPTMVHFSSAWIDELTAQAEQLPPTQQRRLDLEAFLLALLQRLSPPPSAAATSTPWLQEAIDTFRREGDLAEGPAALARLANRSLEHVNRVLRQQLGCTTTQLVNDIRLRKAAHLLRMTNRDIVEVAAESGFANLGYFYRSFTARYRTTPRRYRLAAQAVA